MQAKQMDQAQNVRRLNCSKTDYATQKLVAAWPNLNPIAPAANKVTSSQLIDASVKHNSWT